ncbi:MAG: eukaryotic-like serine/threonine-protein kinase [Myxococcales bacterium]|jgi:serine/threonine-protein kinase|nr:eukaryotic-like serine/threonine-protein kinase [Myxococcales bacterium]
MFVAGERIGAYEILRFLGGGGMGEVYLARHVHIGRQAAIKMLLPELTANQDVVRRFFTEARATGLLRHPNVVEILDCDVHPSGRAYIVMEYLQGESLGQCLARIGSFQRQPAAALAIAGQVADALVAAHAKGIVHRDLKPDNVFLSWPPDDRQSLNVKVLDFGIAKLIGADDGGAASAKTRTGSLLGTPCYMSPEQCRGAGLIDHRTDIYSLGCILFELLSGRPPFVRAGAGEMIAAHLSEEPPVLATLVPTVAAAVNDLVMRMLAKPLDARPQSMVEVVRQIESLLGIPCAQFGALILLPEGVPAPGGNVVQPARTPVRDDAKLESPVVGQTQVLHQSPQALAAQQPRAVAPLPDRTSLPPRASKAPLLVVVVLALVAAGALVVLRGRTNTNPATPTTIDLKATPAAEAAATAYPSADLTKLAPFLRDRSEPPWPEACRTGDRQALQMLATAAGQLAPGATAIERAHGLSLLSALSDGVAERWMLEARANQTTDPDASAKASARLLALCPAAAVGQNLRGNALQKMQQLGPAEAAYQAALALAPDYLAPRFNLGLVQLRQDRNADALASFAAIARVDPNYPHVFLVQAEAQRKMGNQAGAVASLEAEVKHHPDSADGWWQLGRALSSRDPRRANDAFCRASALGHSSAAAVCKPKR